MNLHYLGPLHPSLFIDSSGKEFPEKTDSDSDTEVFFTPSGEGSGVTAEGPLLDKHTWSSSVSSLEGAFLSLLTTPDLSQKKQSKRKRDSLRDYLSQLSSIQRVVNLPLAKLFTPQELFQGVH